MLSNGIDKRIGFVVENNWLNVHYGVRNYFCSIYKILERNGYDVDFISFRQHACKTLWYRVVVDDKDLRSCVKKTTKGEVIDYNFLANKETTSIMSSVQYIGEDVNGLYDVFLFTNPWLLCTPNNIDSTKRTLLICYDVVANELTLTKDINIKEWGASHDFGYQHALKIGSSFLSISKKVFNDIDNIYTPKSHLVLPPVLPYAFFDVSYDGEIKENAVILAAPFDLRKGLKCLPGILNNVVGMDTLYIFGTPRCGQELFDEFFKKLTFKNIQYFDKISSNDLIFLYKKSKVLFFPSLEEGLGLPILEAQVCGCRVVTRNLPPMNQLLEEGSYVMANDNSSVSEQISAMIQDKDFNYKRLSDKAKAKFSVQNVFNVIEQLFQVKI